MSWSRTPPKKEPREPVLRAIILTADVATLTSPITGRDDYDPFLVSGNRTFDAEVFNSLDSQPVDADGSVALGFP